MKKLLFLSIFLTSTLFATAQIDKTYLGLTFFSTDFLTTTQNQSDLLPSRNDDLQRLIINNHLNVQYHYLLTNQLELNIGAGLNLQYYSVKSQVSLATMNVFLAINLPLLPSEDNDELSKLRYTNINATLPIGLKYFFKKDPTAGTQPAFSLQFLSERNVYSRINARYITGRDWLFVHRSDVSSIDSEIERFYEKNVTKIVYSFRVGFSFQNGGNGSTVRHSSFDIHYVHYLNSFDSGITKAGRGISCAWKYQF